MIRRKSRTLFAEGCGPNICNLGEVWIGAGSQTHDRFRERVGEVLVIADSEAIALHDDVAAKTAVIVEERGEPGAFSSRENWSCHRIAAFRERLLSIAPVQSVDSLCDG
jgi:hypothetical protein